MTFLEKLADFAIRRRRVVFLVSFLLAAISLALASQLRLDPDILNLVPADNREVNEFRNALRRLGTIDQHVIAIELPPSSEPDAYFPLVDSLLAEFRKLKEVRTVEGSFPDPVQVVSEMRPHALLLLRPEDLDLAASRFTDEAIREQVARNMAVLQTPQSSAMEVVIREDPFGLLPIFLDKFRTGSGAMKIDASSGYYLSADRSMFVLIVKPIRAAQDLPFARSFLETSNRIVAESLATFRRENPSAAPPRVGATGGYAISVTDAGLIRKDVLLNVVSSSVLILVLFLYAFRRLASLMYAAVPMLLAIAMTFGVAWLVFRSLSPASAVFGALVAGLGVDFITVLYERYIDERNHGATIEAAFARVFRSTVPGVAIAAVTTAGTFYAYLANEFRGMSQLGFLVGTGIVFFFVAVIFLMPALIAQHEGSRPFRPMTLRSFGADWLITSALKRPGVTIVLWSAIILVFGLFARGVRFEGEISSFRSQGNEATALQGRISEKFGQSFSAMMHVTEGRNVDDAVTRSHEAVPLFEQLKSSEAIGSYQSIATILPPEERQRRIIETIAADTTGRFDFTRIETAFRNALAESGFRPDGFDDVLEAHRAMLEPRQPVRFEDLQRSSLAPLLERFIKRDAEGVQSITYLYPRGSAWPREIPEAIQQARNGPTKETITGANLVSASLKAIIQRDAFRSTIAGLVVIFFLFLIAYRSLLRAALMFLPLAAGATVMVGSMALLGLAFNLVNVFVGLMLVGVATDYAVYISQRFFEDPASFDASAKETGKAVAMAAFTSMLGFGSFALSHFPGMRSIGYASLLGIGFSYLASVTLLPAILTRLRRGTPEVASNPGEPGVLHESDGRRNPKG